MTWDVLIGVGVVVAITLLWPSGIGPYGRAQAPDSPDGGGIDDRAFVLVYALTVALVMAFAIYRRATTVHGRCCVDRQWGVHGAWSKHSAVLDPCC